jgi:FKBP-type peptidyl-prolyl cis-trans isomerase
MNRSTTIVSRQLIIALGFFAIPFCISAQKQTKTFTESFEVTKDAVLDINTSYADIEFETWDQDRVTVTATFELEGATKEEAKDYYDNEPIEILGNSKKVSITSKSQGMGLFPDREFNFDFEDFHIDIPDVSSFVVDMSQIAPFPEMVDMPPLPMTKAFRFDYDAYKKDGEVYMKKWQKNFEKSFDEKHQKRLEEWGKTMEKRAEKLQQHMKDQEQRTQDLMDKTAEARAKAAEMRGLLITKRLQGRDSLFAKRDSIRTFFFRTDSLTNGPNVFYSSSNGQHKNYKVKKVIKVRMPKGMRIQMNVRHGEVKLAENTKNLNATLTHSSLWASSIDGGDTKVSASYSPVSVQRWNRGQLQANYSKNVSLSQVLDLQLSTTSSDVTIDELLGKAFIKSDFGPLVIKSLGNTFEELDLSLKNAELRLPLPNSPAAIYIKGTNSELTTPSSLQLVATKNGNTIIHKGNHLKGNGAATIHITSEYSDVVIQ